MSTWSTSRYPTGDSTLVGVTTWYGGDASTYRWNRVEETSPDDTDYIGIQSTVSKVIFSFSSFSIPAGSTIDEVVVYFRARKGGSGASNIRTIMRVGTTDHAVGSGINPSTAWASTFASLINNPHTGVPWTVDQVNGNAASGNLVGFGIGSGDVSPEPQLSQIYIVVAYQWTPPAVSLSVTDCAHAHTADATTISQTHMLAMANALHSQNADATTLLQAHMLGVANALHSQSADAATVTEIVPMLSVANALHNHSVTSATITIQGEGVAGGIFALCLRRSM